MSKRAERRYHLRRMKKKARRIYNQNGIGWKNAEHWANHLAGCSCYQCGNPRNFWAERDGGGRTFPERFADLKLKEGIEDLDD